MGEAWPPRARVALAVAITGIFLAGGSTAGAALTASYGGLLRSVPCPDPGAALCTGLYYGYGIPGVVLALLAIAGLAAAAAGLRTVLRPG